MYDPDHINELQDVEQLLDGAIEAIEKGRAGRVFGEIGPMQMADALRALIQQFEEIDAKVIPAYDNGLGEQALTLAAELAALAEHLELPEARADLEKVSVGIALWVARHDGEISELEFVVNGFAASANITASEETLRTLFQAMKTVLEHAAPSIRTDSDQTNPHRPWRMLNFNFAIVATRTQDEQLMHEAFDTLGRNLPQDAPGFFEEGLRQSGKPVYGPTIRKLMQEYFARWAVRH